ncbi:hypothetical protein N2J76_001592 [Listeria monocytogenes]|uniref:Uncharacterized protein n=1 Tax=Listeria monocytogenes TaxID=1639 RepID=A0A6X6HBJ9_LISMN|nr:hypothetical protein [Listeria monocytogenes]EDO1160436.1 hypothetical protein [Listeria innocua]MDA10114.1 hypothetical protein [Listeria monocytogenes serotype 4b]EAC6073582.1 hypothetical protein [Listeria monocytogenes]EAD2133106.1 hypothetical protein [Listeria monocytogenes]EAD5537082.1 hypothetical protein [Listeria monocytogenes]
MAYSKKIAEEIRKLYASSPLGFSEYTLEQYSQQDVADTVNEMHAIDQEKIQETEIDYTGTARITFNK